MNNRDELRRSDVCGCFYCGQIYSPKIMSEWVPDVDGQTDVCPFCGIDSVIGDASGYPIQKEFLDRMHRYWFESGSLNEKDDC